MRTWILLIMALALLLPLAPALSDEASGIVTEVADGDTITVEGVGVVRLADVDSCELKEACGREDKNYIREMLLGKLVFLDIDNKTGQDRYGRKVAVVYLANSDGSVGENVNCMLMKSGHAILDDNQNNEFNLTECCNSTSSKICNGIKSFVGSKDSNKYHYPECRSAKEISLENQIWFADSEDARHKGYIPCGTCLPV